MGGLIARSRHPARGRKGGVCACVFVSKEPGQLEAERVAICAEKT